MALVRAPSFEWHKGPIAKVNVEALKGCIILWCEKSFRRTGRAWDMGKYETATKVTMAVSGTDMVGLWPLIESLARLQPTLRFVPAQLKEAIGAVMRERPEWQLNRSATLPNAQVARIMALQLGIVLAHWRRISEGKHHDQRLDEACSKLDKFEADMLRLYVTEHRNESSDDVLMSGPAFKKPRVLAPQISLPSSICSEGTCISTIASEIDECDDEGDAAEHEHMCPESDPSGVEHDSLASDLSSDSCDDAVDDTAFDDARNVDEQATLAAMTPLPPGRGVLKALVLKRPAARSCPTAVSPTLGKIKLLLCTHKSYILREDSDTGKWPLVVEATKGNHQETLQKLFEYASTQPADKQHLVQLRNTIELGGHGAGASSSTIPHKDDDDESEYDDEETWWDELAQKM